MEYSKNTQIFQNNCSISPLQSIIYQEVETLEVLRHVAQLVPYLRTKTNLHEFLVDLSWQWRNFI